MMKTAKENEVKFHVSVNPVELTSWLLVTFELQWPCKFSLYTAKKIANVENQRKPQKTDLWVSRDPVGYAPVMMMCGFSQRWRINCYKIRTGLMFGPKFKTHSAHCRRRSMVLFTSMNCLTDELFTGELAHLIFNINVFQCPRSKDRIIWTSLW